MENLTVFVSSADSYSDLWDVFFDLFRKNWPEYDGEIVLNTQNKSYTHPNLNIRCTNVGKLKGFGRTLRAGLDQVKTDNIVFVMIDYIFMGKVNHQLVKEYYDFFLNKDLDTLCLQGLPFTHHEKTDDQRILMAAPPYPNSILFSYQIGFWKKDVFYEMALPHEDPWMSEWYGSRRAEKMQIREGYIPKESDCPFNIDQAGCIHKGYWLDNAIEYLDKNYEKNIDYSKRGLYREHPVYEKLSYRFKIKWIIWKTGLMGSYWDLMKRKPIH